MMPHAANNPGLRPAPGLNARRAKTLSARDEKKLRHDLDILDNFTRTYCRLTHRRADGLCPDCRALLDYSLERRRRCPLDPKPKCKECPVHCYKPAMRARMREVMRVAGMHYVKRGRLDWLVKYMLAS